MLLVVVFGFVFAFLLLFDKNDFLTVKVLKKPVSGEFTDLNVIKGKCLYVKIKTIMEQSCTKY